LGTNNIYGGPKGPLFNPEIGGQQIRGQQHKRGGGDKNTLKRDGLHNREVARGKIKEVDLKGESPGTLEGDY